MLDALRSLAELRSWARRAALVGAIVVATSAAIILVSRLHTEFAEPQRDNPFSDLLAFIERGGVLRATLLLLGSMLVVVVALLVPRRRGFGPAMKQFRASLQLLRRKDGDLVQVLEGSGVLLNESEVQSRLRDFSVDATRIDIFAGDADFLRTDPRQREEIAKFGHRCRLLVDLDQDSPLDELHQVASKGARIKQYPSDEGRPNLLRGRIKHDQKGRAACLFDRVDDQFEVLNIRNRRLLGLVAADFETTFSRGRDPFIRHVLFDLAGVAFTGDIETFFRAVSEVVGTEVPVKGSDHLLVDRELNLGALEIDAVIALRLGRQSLDPDLQRQVRELWLNVWFPDAEVTALAHELRAAGYVTSLCSNCDNLHSEQYRFQKQLDPYHHWFLSNEMQVVKPDDAYFEYMLSELGCESWQCVFIDDAPENIKVASEHGMNAIHVPANRPSGESVAMWIRRELVDLGVAPDVLGGSSAT